MHAFILFLDIFENYTCERIRRYKLEKRQSYKMEKQKSKQVDYRSKNPNNKRR